MRYSAKYRILATYEFESIRLAGEVGDDFRFRVEVLEDLDSGRFRARVWRREYYSMRPSFPGICGDGVGELLSQEMLLVEDFVLLPERRNTAVKNPEVVMQRVALLLEARFGKKRRKARK